MDIIGDLTSQLGISSDKAQALAGSVVGLIGGRLKEEFGEESTRELEDKIPELDEWKRAAERVVGTESESSEGGLSGLLAGVMGGGDDAQGGGLLGSALGALSGARDINVIATILSKIGLDASKAALVAPLLLNFLKSRVGEGTLKQIMSVAPMLTGGGEEGGGLMGALGGFLK